MMVDVKHFESLYPITSRERELSSLVRYVKEGNSVQILSLPGVGRSNVLGLLAYNREVREKHFPTKNAYVHFVLVNFSEVRNRPLLDATKLIFLNLVDSLRERNLQEEYAVTSEIFRESLQFQDELVIFQGLKRAVEYLAVEKKLTLILLFDRFEEYVPILDHDFFSNLRILRNLAKYRFSVIFTLYKPLEDILEAEILSDFHEFVAGHTVFLPLLDEPSLNFRLSYLEQITGKAIDAATRYALLHLTGGHWKLTRAGAEAILAASPSDSLNTSEELSVGEEESLSRDPSGTPQDDKLADFLLKQKTIIGALNEILRSLTPAEMKEFYVILERDNEAIESPEKVAPIAPLQDDKIYEYFENIGLVSDGAIAIPLLTSYLREHYASLPEERQHIVFDQEKNVIRKGETVLSDGLTASEFRLLAYLLNNPERVVEREEIISVVWQDAKSTAGVTDQAVDQLIFRIRRKIEPDPNNPQHLKTIKGRGFSFTP